MDCVAKWAPSRLGARVAAALVGAACLQLGACSERLEDGGVAAGSLPDRSDATNRRVWIEGGSFVAGSEPDDADAPAASPYSRADESQGRWSVGSFWLQEHEVTNEEYHRFDSAHAFPPGTERHPVVDVTWREALAYAQALGGTLPTEVQWEYAARGPEGREYPWGDEAPTCERTHYVECEPRGAVEVMSRPGDVTPEGVHDLAGNVREWVKPIWFDDARHPVNPDAIRLKGGSWAHLSFFLRAASVTNYIAADYSWDNIGFRVAWPAVQPR